MSTTILNDEDVAPLQLPDRYEVIDGEIVELPPMSGLASEIANRIHSRLDRDSSAQSVGRPRMDMLFRIPLTEDRDRNRRPDVVFVSFERWPDSRPLSYRGNPIDVVPELIVEVASPTDSADDLLLKAMEYLRGGATLVWLVFPRVQSIYAYSGLDAPRVFRIGDILNGEPLLPGFRVPVADLFPIMDDVPELPSDLPRK